MAGTYNAPGRKYKGQDDAPDETPSPKKRTETAAAAPTASAAAKAEEPKQSAVTNASGQIALVGSSIDPEYEKAKEKRRKARALAASQADGLEGY